MESQKRHGEEEREQLIKRYKSSGLSREAFCAKHGLLYTTFKNWFRRRTPEVCEDESRMDFATIKLSGPNQQEAAEPSVQLPPIIICKSNGVHVEVSPLLSPPLLKNIFTMMGACK